MDKKVEKISKEKRKELFIDKLRIVRYDTLCKEKSEFSREFFYISVPVGDVGGKMTYKLIDLLKEFPYILKDFCKTHNLIIKSNKSKKILYFINKPK